MGLLLEEPLGVEVWEAQQPEPGAPAPTGLLAVPGVKRGAPEKLALRARHPSQRVRGAWPLEKGAW